MRQSLTDSLSETLNKIKIVETAVLHAESSAPNSIVRIATTNGLVVYLAAVIEEGVRELFKAFLEDLYNEVSTNSQLPPKLIQSNYKAIGETLKNLSKSTEVDAPMRILNIFNDINTAHNNGECTPFFKSQLTHNQSNMKSSQVAEISSRNGIPKLWRKVSSTPEIKLYYSVLKPNQIETKLLIDWNELFGERDTIMHKNSQATGLGASIISNYAAMFQVALTGISKVLDESITELSS